MTELYGLTGMFVATNQSYVPPRVKEVILEAFYELDDEYDEEYDEDEEAGVLTVHCTHSGVRSKRRVQGKS